MDFSIELDRLQQQVARMTSAEQAADRAENDALNAIDFAARTSDTLRLAILDAIDGRADANAHAGAGRASARSTPHDVPNARRRPVEHHGPHAAQPQGSLL